MKMKTNLIILLGLAVVIPKTFCQNTQCEPPQIPESAIDCNAVDSEFVRCACDTFKPAILDIMGSLSCLIPGLDLMPTTTTTTVQPTTTTQELTNTTPGVVMMERGMDVVTERVSVFPGIGGPFINEKLMGLIRNITTALTDDVFDSLCPRLSQLQQCVSDEYKASTKPLDLEFKKILDLDNLQNVLSNWCSLREEIKNSISCISKSMVSLYSCVGLSVASGGFQNPYSEGYCPLSGDLFKCMSIQIRGCSPKIADAIKSTITDLLTPRCKSLAMEGTKSPLMSTFTMCGLSFSSDIISNMGAMQTQTQPTSDDIQSIIDTAIDIQCEGMPEYFKCVNRELPGSKNPMDLFIQALVDVKQFMYADAVSDHICNPTRIQDIKSMIPCAIGRGPQLPACASSTLQLLSTSFNISTIGINPNNDRETLCGPIKILATCAIEEVIRPCDANVGKFADDMFFWIMRTDCNGARNGTFQEVIEAARQQENGSSALINNTLMCLFAYLIAIVSSSL